uniref:AMP-dependent synthetase/ligase domain-containing protein n=1 Tax=Bionectria ochroleuca TaxID=29856 RepID=A0A0B7KR67_BIOOC
MTSAVMADGIIPSSIWSQIVDDRATEAPDRVFCEILENNWQNTGPRKITYGEISRAVNRLCWWLEEKIGVPKASGSFVYVGDNDLRYVFVLIASQKTQRQVVLIEPRDLTDSGLLSLLEHTKCSHWVGGSSSYTDLKKGVLEARSEMAFSTLPPLSHLLQDEKVQDYPFVATWDEIKANPVFVIHSSGTTGDPRPLSYSLEMSTVGTFSRRLPDGSEENPELRFTGIHGTRVLWVAPPQWLGGIMGFLLMPVFNETIPIWPPCHEAPLTPAPIITEILGKIQPDGGFYVPSTIRELCLKEQSLQLLKKQTYIMYGGAPLDEWVGDLLCTEVDFHVVVGSTETSRWPLRKLQDPLEWRYYWIDERLGYRLEHVDGDLYELVLERKPEWRRFQGAFIMFPTLDVYHTQDLYTPHPTKPGHVRYRGRKDDLLKFKWLAKVRATDLEEHFNMQPNIKAAMVGGNSKPSPFLIVEPETDKELDLDEVQSMIKLLNQSLSPDICIPLQNVIIASAERPLVRLGKGTLDRRRTIDEYKEEIERLYI